MSVQAGVWNFDGATVDPSLLTRMSNDLVNHPPHEDTVHQTGGLAFLYCAFRPTSESCPEKQPYITRRGHVITWDGRLDNRDELSQQIGDRLKNPLPDMAIVGEAFDEWGTDCLRKLIGEWALTIWNPAERTLILARDYVGVRQLFYHHQANRIRWCTQLEPLVLSSGRLTLCPRYLAGYLILWPDADLTPYQEIQSVPPGGFVSVAPDNLRVHHYWNFNPKLKTRYRQDAEYEEHFRFLFRRAVRRRLCSEGYMLAELSGGLDSTSIVCMADDILSKEGAPATGLNTFSYFNPNDPADDDRPFYEAAEQRRGRAGIHVSLGDDLSFHPGDSTFSAFPGQVERQELKEAAQNFVANGYRAVLSGTGGDEMLGNALDPRIQIADLLLECRFPEFSRQLVAWSSRLREPCLSLLGQCFALVLPGRVRRLIQTSKVDAWIGASFAKQQRVGYRQLEAVEGSWLWLPSVRDSFQTIRTLSRQMSQKEPASLEKRYPYLDQELVEFLTSVPTSQILRLGERRSLMRRALRQLLPTEVLARRTKASAPRCFVLSLRKQWTTLEPVLASPLISRLGYVNKPAFHDAVLGIRDGHVAPNFLCVIKAVSAELWLRSLVHRGIVSIDSSKGGLPYASREIVE